MCRQLNTEANRIARRLRRLECAYYFSGTTTVELIVAMVVLATAVVGVGRFASNTGQGLRARELSSRIGWELANAREQIGSWQPASIAVDKIESLSFSESLRENLDDLRWQAEVEAVSEPAHAIRVVLTLHCRLQDQPARPASLVFWVDAGPLSVKDREAEEL